MWQSTGARIRWTTAIQQCIDGSGGTVVSSVQVNAAMLYHFKLPRGNVPEKSSIA